MNEELFDRFDSLTFDDVLIVPGYTEVLPNETDVTVQLTTQICLNIPILSAAMDTVTEARLAIALAREGGMGIIHRNMPPEVQAGEVEKVKRSQSGMIVEPISLSFIVGTAAVIMTLFAKERFRFGFGVFLLGSFLALGLLSTMVSPVFRVSASGPGTPPEA